MGYVSPGEQMFIFNAANRRRFVHSRPQSKSNAHRQKAARTRANLFSYLHKNSQKVGITDSWQPYKTSGMKPRADDCRGPPNGSADRIHCGSIQAHDCILETSA